MKKIDLESLYLAAYPDKRFTYQQLTKEFKFGSKKINSLIKDGILTKVEKGIYSVSKEKSREAYENWRLKVFLEPLQKRDFNKAIEKLGGLTDILEFYDYNFMVIKFYNSFAFRTI